MIHAEESMTEPRPRKPRRLNRRYLLAGTLLALLIAVVASFAWERLRPLNAMEGRLVGQWHNETNGMTFTLGSDRYFYRDGIRMGGQRYCEDDKLYFPETFKEELGRKVWSAVRGRSWGRSPTVITFTDNDNVSNFVPINGCTFHWRRISPEE